MSALARSGLILVGFVVLAAPAVVEGQSAPPQRPGDVQTELVLRREIFRYPAFARRNPFVPVEAVAEGEVSAAELRLIGVLLDTDPSRSVAILGTSQASVTPEGTLIRGGEGESWYMKVGDSLGNITLVEIHPDRVVVDVQEFGLTDRITIMLETGNPGGIR